jgi:phosphatidate phosphatase APP1
MIPSRLRLNKKPIVKVYHGYGDESGLLVYGHVLKRGPLPRMVYRKNFWSNARWLLRLFLIKPWPQARVTMEWQGVTLETTTEPDGQYRFEWKSDQHPTPGWHTVEVFMTTPNGAELKGKGKVLVPYPTQYAFISDIDDTFLISHSKNAWKKLRLLLTQNAHSRKPFEGVAEHYRQLALGNTTADAPNPFFYVSSSEWNLYDYLLDFKQCYGIPEGVYLLNQLKAGLGDFLKTGATGHSGKFTRIVRVLQQFKNQQFVLLGDDTQRDPYIYREIVKQFDGRIICVYLRHVGRHKKKEVDLIADEIRAMGVEVCYFNDSREAMLHSERKGLINQIVDVPKN